MALFRRLIAGVLPFVPRPIVAKVARRYVAGDAREDAVGVVRRLEGDGLLATVDFLGENVESEAEAVSVADEYAQLLREFHAAGLGAHVSVKLTHVGLRLSEDLALRETERLVRLAEDTDSFVRIDMEDSTTTDATLRIFRRLREASPRIGVAIQAYLRRSADDVESLLDLAPNLRICKGIYREDPSIAFERDDEIRQSFLALADRILEAGAYPAFATHDKFLVDRLLERVVGVRLIGESATSDGAAAAPCEFQMLLGVGEPLRPRIRRAGFPLRIYCPYGADWYEYSVRRLRENPKIAGHVVRAMLRPRWARRAGA